MHHNFFFVYSIFKQIQDCFYVKTAKVCGLQAASYIKQLVSAVITAVIDMKCTNIRSKSTVTDVMKPTKNITRSSKHGWF